MPKTTFTPGTRVRAFPSGELGTVADVPRISEQFQGFTPVIFDGRDKATPCATRCGFVMTFKNSWDAKGDSQTTDSVICPRCLESVSIESNA